MAFKAHWLKKTVALALPGYLLAVALAGCGGAASSASLSAAPSSVAAPSSMAISSSTVVSSLPPAFSLPPAPAPAQSTPPSAAAAPTLQVEDFNAYLEGKQMVAPLDVAFHRFSFAQNAVWHKLDPQALSTKRGLKLGSTPQDITAQYGGLPVDIRSLNKTGSWVSQRHGSYEEFLQAGAPPTNYYVVFFQYLIDGASATPDEAAAAIAANAHTRLSQIHRYEIIFQLHTGVVADVFLSFSNTTPLPVGNMTTYGTVLENESLTVSLNGLFTSPESFGLYLGLHNGFNQPLTAVCKTTMVSGKATRDVAILRQSMPAVGYADALLEIPNDTARAAGIERISSIAFTIELRNDQGQTVYTSGPITANFITPEEPPPT